MICLPLLAKQYFPRQRRPAFTDWETRGRLCFLRWSTTRPITTFFQPVKSSEIENETVNGEEAEAEAINTSLKFAFFLAMVRKIKYLNKPKENKTDAANYLQTRRLRGTQY